ncbi:MAG TPA: fatty acid--CoA ligase family protein, partial [Aggregicoccus sp.]|nr:fatty acid--CoA ligase family protein [Aggregicoccus sp.]
RRQGGSALLLARDTLRYVTQAGGALAPETLAWARGAFAPARFFVMYGQTEATARLSYVPPERLEEKAGSIGVPVPGVELRVVSESGAPLGAGESGHLVARGESICPGYFQDAEATREVLRDGWLWTGDLAYRDADGFLFLVGRAKEILKVGGHRVSPQEIEHALLEHPSVLEAAVVGLPDPLEGECAVAAVVLREPSAALDPELLRRHCRERLPAHKVPRHVLFLEALPRGGSGKVQRSALRTTLAPLLSTAHRLARRATPGAP